MIELLGNWEDDATVLATQSEEYHTSELVKDSLIHTENPSVYLATKIHVANAGDLNQFVGLMQFDVKKPETYTRAMQGPNNTEWVRVMKEKLDQLHKNNTWILVLKSKIKPGH